MPNSESDVWEYLRQRFGVKRREFSNFDLQRIAGDWWLHTGTRKIDLEYETRGIRFVRETGEGLKPTTYALQLIGPRISRNVVEVDKEELEKLLKREEMIERDLETGEGYVAIKYEAEIIGCGMYKDGVVSSRVPKGRGKELANFL